MEARAGLTAGLHQRQEQKVQPRLYQAMDLLHMPLLDLQRHLRQELVSNPFLEEAPYEDGPAEEVDWEEVLLDDFDPGGVRPALEEREDFSPAVTQARSLWHHLRDQLHLLRVDERERAIGEEIIGNIDRDGFLTCDPELIAEALTERLTVSPAVEPAPGTQPAASVEPVPGAQPATSAKSAPGAQPAASAEPAPGTRPAPAATPAPGTQPSPGPEAVTRSEVEDVLRRIQKFEPSGIGARDLRETLLLQLAQKGREASLEYRIVRDHFDELADHRWHELGEAFGITPQEAQAAGDEIAKLDPKPGLRYANVSEDYVVADLTVEKVDGRYVVVENHARHLRLKLSETYRAIAADGGFDGESKAFITERLNSAQWLLQAVEQRRQTMVRVMEVIVGRQEAFFEKGAEALRPLTLREVARELEMHESTISRVTNGKYVQTPRGLHPLKFFFSGGYSQDGGADVSARGVRQRIARLIAGEDEKAPLSDPAIVQRLGRDGVKIARRTVAKYREQLGILPARLRQRV